MCSLCIIFGFCLFFVGSYFGVLIVLGVGFDLAQIRLQFGFDLGSSFGFWLCFMWVPFGFYVGVNWVLLGFYDWVLFGFYVGFMWRRLGSYLGSMCVRCGFYVVFYLVSIRAVVVLFCFDLEFIWSLRGFRFGFDLSFV